MKRKLTQGNKKLAKQLYKTYFFSLFSLKKKFDDVPLTGKDLPIPESLCKAICIRLAKDILITIDKLLQEAPKEKYIDASIEKSN